MKYAHIENGVVVNVILAENPLSEAYVPSDTAQIGDLYDGTVFTTPTPVIPVPAEVSPAQFRRALNALNLRASVEAAVAQADQDTQDMWEYSTSFHRDNALLITMAELLNISTQQLDDVFILAGSL